jgi:6-phosphogluconolactonase
MVKEVTDPQKTASEYEKELREFFRSLHQKWPRFDLVILGIGTDGHTASLFPGSPVLTEKKRWVVAPFVPKIKAYRLTLTLPVFNHAARVIFLVAGKEKAPVLKEGLGTYHPQVRFPYQLIKPRHGQTIFFLDAAASRFMDRSKATE